MAASGTIRIEQLNRENYDTWKIQMQAILTKNDVWTYVNGNKPKPEFVEADDRSAEAVRKWTAEDEKAKADIILSIKPSELTQIKGCTTSRELWIKLQGIYQPTGPARKAALIKQLTYHRMNDGEDVREHILAFFETVDKLSEMDIQINPDLLSVMLLHSLPASFANFRCAIETRDSLPSPETLRIKITEENDARKSEVRDNGSTAMFAKKSFNKKKPTWKKNDDHRKNEAKKNPSRKEPFKFRCHKCRKIGHKAADCNERSKNDDDANAAEDISLCARTDERTKTYRKAFTSEDSLHRESWCLDSGCTSHMCTDNGHSITTSVKTAGRVHLANDAYAEIMGKGTVSLATEVDGRTRSVKLTDTLYVPELRTNLLSVGRICDKGLKVTFDKDKATVIDKNGNSILKASRASNGLYCLQAKDMESTANAEWNDEANTEFRSTESWHRKMGHLNFKDLVKCAKDRTVDGMKLTKFPEDDYSCETCIRGKLTRASFPKKSERKTKLLEIIHTDVCGPMRTESLGRSRYFITFIDDASRWCEVKFLKKKSDALQAFKEYKAMVENQTGRHIRFLQSDNGTEYINTTFDAFLKDSGISRRLAVPYTPEQNGVAERKNRTLMETARCMLLDSSLPKYLWAEAINTANFIRNRCPSSSIEGRTPFEKWTGKIPNVAGFEIFGCSVMTLSPEPQRDKWSSKSKPGKFVGYSETSKGFRIYSPKEQKIQISRDVRIMKEVSKNELSKLRCNNDPLTNEETECERETIDIPTKATSSAEHGNDLPSVPANDYREPLEDKQRRGPVIETTEESEAETAHDDLTEKRRGPGRPRIQRTGRRGRPRKLFHDANSFAETAFSSEIPVAEAVRGRDSEEWLDAIAGELRSILKNDTWSIVTRPRDVKVLGSRVLLRNKMNKDGTLKKRKARIVAKGFAQRPGIDYDDAFAPVARMESVRTLAALAAEHNMTIKHFDVATAFLNGKLLEKVYMELPKNLHEALEALIDNEPLDSEIRGKAVEMLKALRGKDKVCLLNKAIYGLRQAGRCWHDKLSKTLLDFGARRSSADPCVFYKGQRELLTLIVIYVDDILVASKQNSRINELYQYLSRNFETRDLGSIKHCLGMEFEQTTSGISIKQRGYIANLLDRFGMRDAKPVSTPLQPGIKLHKSDSAKGNESSYPFQELIGSLMYLAICTRPDIAHAVTYLSQFNLCHDSTHWSAAKRILRYLKGTSDLGLTYKKTGRPMHGYVDADWGNCVVERRSFTGYAFLLSGCPIAWASRKQRTVALSSVEAEYMALTEAAKEAYHLKQLLLEFDQKKSVIKVYCDSNGARKLAENPVFHSRTKHIDVRHHFVRDAVEKGVIKIEYLDTNDMAADALTKGLPRPKHVRCLELLGIKD